MNQLNISEWTKPRIMGILNATPDSFYNKGQSSDALSLLKNAEKMLREGAAILDIGGASTKPGQEIIDPDEELGRVMPVIEAITKQFPDAILSIDTYNSKVAKEAVLHGVSIINDVSSGAIDGNMLAVVAELEATYVAMHMQGIPKTMQVNPVYDDVVSEVYEYLRNTIARCEGAGIKNIIIDPGFGFGKTVAHNFQILGALSHFKALGRPILVGISRKSMVCKPLRVNPEHALNGTTALHMVALQQGTNILRVHDVKEAMEVIILAEQLGVFS